MLEERPTTSLASENINYNADNGKKLCAEKQRVHSPEKFVDSWIPSVSRHSHD